jgi:hypothetical protein
MAVRPVALVVLALLMLPAAASAAPRASTFSAPVLDGGGARAASSVVTVAPGRRFDVVGLRWRRAPRGEHLELRVREDGRWRRWVHVPSAHTPAGSDPVWAGGADALQLRGTAGAKGLRAHFVRVTGSRKVSSRRARAAQAGQPPAIVGRAEWGANQCRPRDTPTIGRVQMAFVHHTVSANDYGPEDSAGMVLGICRFHRDTNGWDDVGYNFLVDKYGTIFEGRAGGIDQAVVGAQAQGWNDDSTGIANLGTYQDVPQTDAALDALGRLIAWKLPLHGAPVEGKVTLESDGGASNRHPRGRYVTYDRISGHRDGNSTECPGAQLYAQLPRLRQIAAGRAPRIMPGTPQQQPVGGGMPAPPVLTLQAAGTALAFPEPVRLTGRLIDQAGSPMAGARVGVQVLTPGRLPHDAERRHRPRRRLGRRAADDAQPDGAGGRRRRGLRGGAGERPAGADRGAAQGPAGARRAPRGDHRHDRPAQVAPRGGDRAPARAQHDGLHPHRPGPRALGAPWPLSRGDPAHQPRALPPARALRRRRAQHRGQSTDLYVRAVRKASSLGGVGGGPGGSVMSRPVGRPSPSSSSCQ